MRKGIYSAECTINIGKSSSGSPPLCCNFILISGGHAERDGVGGGWGCGLPLSASPSATVLVTCGCCKRILSTGHRQQIFISHGSGEEK